MYRLGQKTLEFKNVTVEFFAPYLLKDGMVQVKLTLKCFGSLLVSIINGAFLQVSIIIIDSFQFILSKILIYLIAGQTTQR